MTLLAFWSVGIAAADTNAGKSIYAAKCQTCHGTSGRGDGPAARALPNRPRDFSSPGFWSSTTEAQVRQVIRQGKPGSIMRGFPMPDRQLSDLMLYLRSLEQPAE